MYVYLFIILDLLIFILVIFIVGCEFKFSWIYVLVDIGRIVVGILIDKFSLFIEVWFWNKLF